MFYNDILFNADRNLVDDWQGISFRELVTVEHALTTHEAIKRSEEVKARAPKSTVPYSLDFDSNFQRLVRQNFETSH